MSFYAFRISDGLTLPSSIRPLTYQKFLILPKFSSLAPAGIRMEIVGEGSTVIPNLPEKASTRPGGFARDPFQERRGQLGARLR
jgi:hypothetical protein